MARPARILIVDDEPTILMSLAYWVRRTGAEVTSCLTREAAERALRAGPFDVAILDVRLSGSEGLEGLRLLGLAKQVNPDARVILMTGYGSEEIRRGAAEAGADHYCDKPVNLETLLALLRDAAGSAPEP